MTKKPLTSEDLDMSDSELEAYLIPSRILRKKKDEPSPLRKKKTHNPPTDLNALTYFAREYGGHQRLLDHKVVSTDGSTVCMFRRLKHELILRIREADVILGSVAWLTDFDILSALSGRYCCMVVQKEDFLRPDDEGRGWKSRLRSAYDALWGVEQSYFPEKTIPGLLYRPGDSTLPTVRCVGNFNADRNPAFPRAHHKFAVFARLEEEDLVPFGVWTGSFNWTANASNSLENAIYSTDPNLVAAYCQEWQQVLALSEPLDWESDWCAPEFRIGS